MYSDPSREIEPQSPQYGFGAKKKLQQPPSSSAKRSFPTGLNLAKQNLNGYNKIDFTATDHAKEGVLQSNDPNLI